MEERSLECRTDDLPPVRRRSPVPDAHPQVAEEAGPAVAPVSFAEPLVASELLQLTEAVGQQHVRQLLLSKAWHVLWLL